MKKIALITGGSRGIGAATATLLARQSYIVIVNYATDQQSATNVVDKIKTFGGRAVAIQADISNDDQVVDMVNQASFCHPS